MSLTVPKAGIIAGRSATPQSAGADQTGAALSQLGDRMLQIGTQLEGDRLQRQAGRLQVDMAKDLNALRLEFDQMNDADRIDAEWQPRLEMVRQKYAEGVDENGRPLVDRKHKDAVLTAFDDLANRHGMSVARHGIGVRASERAATRMTIVDEAVSQAASAAPEAAAAVKAMAMDRIATDLEAGHITHEQATREAQALMEATDDAVALQVIAQDPEAFLERAAAGAFDGMDGVKRARYIVRAKSALATRETAAQKEQARAAELRSAEIGKQMQATIDVLAEGKPSPNEQFVEDQEWQAHPDYPAFRARYDLINEKPGLMQMSPAELRAEIAAEQKAPASQKFQTERLGVLRGILEASEKGWQSDAPAYARQIGINIPELPQFDPTDPAAFGEAVATRSVLMGAIEAQDYTPRANVFSQAERAQLKPALAINADPGAKSALVTSVVKSVGREKAPAVLAELAGMDTEAGRVIEHVTGLLARGADPALAQEVFEGQKMKAEGTVNMPGATMRRAMFDEMTGNMFANDPARLQLMEMADALYAANAPGVDPEDTSRLGILDGPARDIYAAAVARALGATPDRNGNLTVGGLQEIRGAATLLPPGVPVASVEQALEAVERDLIGRYERIDPKNTLEQKYVEPDLGRLTAASVTGAAPNLGDPDSPDYAPDDVFEDLQMMPLGNGEFYFVRDRGGRMLPVLEQGSREVYRFRLTTLIEAAQ